MATGTPVRLLLLGGGGTAADVIDIIADMNRAGAELQCEGVLDDNPALWRSKVHGVPVIGGIDMARDMEWAVLVNTLGSPANPLSRRIVTRRLGLTPERFASLVHPTASIASSAQLGPGCIVYPHVTIMAHARLGNQVTVLASSVLNHDVTVADFATIASGVNVAGNAAVGDGAYLGAACSVRNGVKVGAESMVGMGSVVLDDVPDGATVAGCPARALLHR